MGQMEAGLAGAAQWTRACKLSSAGAWGLDKGRQSLICGNGSYQPRPPAHLQPLFSFPGEVQQDLINCVRERPESAEKQSYLEQLLADPELGLSGDLLRTI